MKRDFDFLVRLLCDPFSFSMTVPITQKHKSLLPSKLNFEISKLDKNNFDLYAYYFVRTNTKPFFYIKHAPAIWLESLELYEMFSTSDWTFRFEEKYHFEPEQSLNIVLNLFRIFLTYENNEQFLALIQFLIEIIFWEKLFEVKKNENDFLFLQAIYVNVYYILKELYENAPPHPLLEKIVDIANRLLNELYPFVEKLETLHNQIRISKNLKDELKDLNNKEKVRVVYYALKELHPDKKPKEVKKLARPILENFKNTKLSSNLTTYLYQITKEKKQPNKDIVNRIIPLLKLQTSKISI